MTKNVYWSSRLLSIFLWYRTSFILKACTVVVLGRIQILRISSHLNFEKSNFQLPKYLYFNESNSNLDFLQFAENAQTPSNVWEKFGWTNRTRTSKLLSIHCVTPQKPNFEPSLEPGKTWKKLEPEHVRIWPTPNAIV